jgi:murein DD-endopeptidase MepM/ murein hydrolase activator NlpD
MRKISFEGTRRKLLATVMTAAMLGACSSDVTRFGDDPFENPYRSSATGSISRAKAQAPRVIEPVGSSSVSTQALPPPNTPIASVASANVAPRAAALTTGSVGSANYPNLGGATPAPSTVLGSNAGWSAVGGTPITLKQGEGLNTLSSRYNVPVSALLAVNGLSSASQVQPGQQIMIPAYNAVAGAKAKTAGSVIRRDAPAAQPLPAATAQAMPAIAPKVAEVVPAKAVVAQPPKAPVAARAVAPTTVSDAERRAAAKLKEMKASKVADDDDEDDKPSVKKTPTKAVPVKQVSAKQAEDKKAEAATKAAESKALAEAEKAKAAKIAAARKARADDAALTTSSVPEIKPVAKVTQPMPKAEPEKEASAAVPAEADAASFRWPAKGRVISGFGARGTGGANDGINIALPEGTPVRAAEGGTVVHADDALKGYGKLVLIRHTNGFVSVYAHNGELNVKRGESVKRGQVIAKSGQSGNVNAPQLHFEIRKGSTPIDPTKHLGE